MAACKRKAKDYAALKQTNYDFVPIALEMPSGRMADVSQQGLRRVVREQGATEEMVRSVFADLAAAVVASQRQYANERVAIHLSQQRARRGKRRHRRRVRVYSAKGRRRQQEGAQAEQAVAEEVQAERAVEGGA